MRGDGFPGAGEATGMGGTLECEQPAYLDADVRAGIRMRMPSGRPCNATACCRRDHGAVNIRLNSRSGVDPQ